MQRAPRVRDLAPTSAIERWSREIRAVEIDPARRLMLAVLQEAVLTLIDVPNHPSLHRLRLIQEAETWVASCERAHPFAFASICEALNLDMDCLRAAITEWRRHSGS